MFSLILHGRRSVESQKWRNLRVSINLLQNASAYSSVSLQGDTAFTISYLVDSLGLTTKLAQSISKKVNFDEKKNPDSVLNLLRSEGFKDSQISKIIRSYPALLIEDAETSLRPKLEILKSRGVSISELTEIISEVPKILTKRREKSIGLYFDFVRDVMQDVKVSDCLREGRPWNRIRNVSVLRELGVPQKLLFSLLIAEAKPVCGKAKFEESVKKVVEMGFDPTKPKFVEALHVIYEISDKTIQEKVNVYKRLGFSDSDIWASFKRWPFFLKYSEKKINKIFDVLKKCGLVDEEVVSVLKMRPELIRYSEEKILESIETFRGLGFHKDDLKKLMMRNPQCTGYSSEMIKKKFEFVVKKMNWLLEDVVAFSTVFGYSMEKRTVPRCNVIKALMSKGLIGRINPPISSVLVCNDDEFLNRYVMKHDKLVPELMAIFTKDRLKPLCLKP